MTFLGREYFLYSFRRRELFPPRVISTRWRAYTYLLARTSTNIVARESNYDIDVRASIYIHTRVSIYIYIYIYTRAHI